MNTLSLFALANRFMKTESKPQIKQPVEDEEDKMSQSDESLEDLLVPLLGKSPIPFGIDFKKPTKSDTSKDKMKSLKRD